MENCDYRGSRTDEPSSTAQMEDVIYANGWAKMKKAGARSTSTAAKSTSFGVVAEADAQSPSS